MTKEGLVLALIKIEQLGLESSIASYECGRTLSDIWVAEKRKRDSAFCNALQELREKVLRSGL